MKKGEAAEMVKRAEHAVQVLEKGLAEATGYEVDVKKQQLGAAKDLLKRAQKNFDNAEDC
jgi:hypothetical protein